MEEHKPDNDNFDAAYIRGIAQRVAEMADAMDNLTGPRQRAALLVWQMLLRDVNLWLAMDDVDVAKQVLNAAKISWSLAGQWFGVGCFNDVGDAPSILDPSEGVDLSKQLPYPEDGEGH